jgi:glycosyltransferase involved in cell wall biosynthesis
MSLPELGAEIQTPAPPRAAGELLVFADDWGRHPSSCQHLIRQLLPRWNVLWVNTIGTRKPRLDWATVKRAWGKVRGQRPEARGQQEGSGKGFERILSPSVLNPFMWPYFARSHDRWLNRKLLTRAIAPRLRGKDVTAITTLPITADLVGALPVKKWVYYCVDDFSQWPGLDGRTLETMERELVAKVDTIVCAGEVLRERMRALGREDAELLTHGVDREHWSVGVPASACSEVRQAKACTRTNPTIVFWGLIDRRLDIAWLEALSSQLTHGEILLVGPTQNPDLRLTKLPRVALRPAMSFDELPALAASASVLIMPYADLPVTRAMQPLKMLEYLATGKPVVVRDLPAVTPWRDTLDACNDAETFAAGVLRRMVTGIPAEQLAARERLKEESWEAKAKILERWL